MSAMSTLLYMHQYQAQSSGSRGKHNLLCYMYIAGTAKPHQVDHVRWVFKKSKDSVYQASLLKTQQKSFVGQMNTSRVLKFVAILPFFKYPTKIVCIILVQLVATYMLSLLIISPCIWIKEIIVAKLLSNKTKLIASFFIDVVYHMLKLFQGDKHSIRDFTFSSCSNLASSVGCAGYLLIFTVWSKSNDTRM
ncbi:stimulated by retinoic acid 6 protein isoform X3 [Biomphalaria pfeifferi]|uniref:Stimulated by retinoic acid 6 protein isoform X3 n=1 Tax=Biomphalaria pfeifferi TaxID=112525 RepID=A0AAD8BA22_BIOPF|nr:stimulated by retinoic acid 6 protein isoform X3 [Biomphalaria pfeifferi]